MYAVQRRGELLLIGRRSRRIVGRRRVVVDFAQGHAMPAPATLELALVIVNQHALGVDDVNLAGALIQIEKENAAGEHVGVLIILREPRSGRPRRAMSEIPQELPV